jgi:hypothetical protein
VVRRRAAESKASKAADAGLVLRWASLSAPPGFACDVFRLFYVFPTFLK